MNNTDFIKLYEKLSKLTESNDYDEYEDDEVEEDDYDEEDDWYGEDDEVTLIPRISVTIFPKDIKDMPLLTKHIEEVLQDPNTVSTLEMCVAGNWKYKGPIFAFDEELDYYEVYNDRITLYFVGNEIDWYFPSDAYSLEGSVKQDLDFDTLERSAEVNTPDEIVEGIVTCFFKESVEEDFLDEFKCFEGSKYTIEYSVNASDWQYSFQDGDVVVKEATIVY